MAFLAFHCGVDEGEIIFVHYILCEKIFRLASGRVELLFRLRGRAAYNYRIYARSLRVAQHMYVIG